MKINHKIIIKEYKKGKSTYVIAREMGYKPNSVRVFLRNKGLIRKALGRDVEEKVAKYFKRKGSNVIPQRGDCCFDMIIDGKKINVKSAHKSASEQGKTKNRYNFDINHYDSLFTNYHKDFDEFYFVFLDEPKMPIYSLGTNEIFLKRILCITNINNTKYPIKFIGNLK